MDFTTFDPPGSIQTRGIAINNSGVIGGRFLDTHHMQRGYLLDHGIFTIFEFQSVLSGAAPLFQQLLYL